jgi:UDPglucose 6-dehydrogenase/GDP-mannose 6-dehydrogenase
MRISIIGTGYVGLVTGACLSERGHQVICVDVDPGRVSALNGAKAPIFEVGLDDLLSRNVGRRLFATTDLRASVLTTDVTLIAVGTPFDKGSIDLTDVLTATQQIGDVLMEKDGYHVVAVKSTVVPGTTDGQVLPLLEASSGKKAGVDFGVGMNPEFLSEGEAVEDFMRPDRIVLGGIDERTQDALEEVYRPFVDAPRIRTSNRTAEMIKYASNALLATLISFSNEFANLGAALGGIDASEVMQGVQSSQYFRKRTADGSPPITAFLRPGCGFGGSCLPKDVSALISHGRSVGQEMRLLEAVIRINDEQPARAVDLVAKHWSSLKGVRVAVLGLAFKAGTNDVRHSPALKMIRDLVARGATVTAFDPVAQEEAVRALLDSPVNMAPDLRTAVADASAIIVATPWPEFGVVPALVNAREPQPLLVDCRRAFDSRSVGWYEGIGL